MDNIQGIFKAIRKDGKAICIETKNIEKWFRVNETMKKFVDSCKINDTVEFNFQEAEKSNFDLIYIKKISEVKTETLTNEGMKQNEIRAELCLKSAIQFHQINGNNLMFEKMPYNEKIACVLETADIFNKYIQKKRMEV